MDEQRALVINPIVPESIQHNAKVLSNIRALTASLFGVAAGILGLESYPGFLFYLLGTLVVSTLVYVLKINANPASAPASSTTGGSGGAKAFFYRPGADLWLGDVAGNAMGFVLTWTLFYGLVRA